MGRKLRRPSAKLGIWSLLWSVWAFGVTVVLGGILMIAPGQITIPRMTSYAGLLSSGSAPRLVTLPAGAVVQDFLVQTGDEVVAGQTVGVLNTKAMQHTLTRLQVDFAVARSKRKCFASQGVLKSPEPGALSDQRDEIAIAAAIDECRLYFSGRAEAREMIKRRVSLLLERRRLIQQRFNLNMAEDPLDGALKVQTAVELMLARNALDAELLELEQTAHQNTQDQEQFRLNQINQLADEISRIIALQARLTRLLTDPRLVAPADGTVLHVRNPGPTARQLDTDVLTLRAASADPPNLALLVPRDDLPGLKDGTIVQVLAQGIPGWDVPLAGTLNLAARYSPTALQGLDAGQPDMVAVPVQLDDSVTSGLQDLPIFNQAGGTAQARVDVRLGRQSFDQVLSQEFRTLPFAVPIKRALDNGNQYSREPPFI